MPGVHVRQSHFTIGWATDPFRVCYGINPAALANLLWPKLTWDYNMEFGLYTLKSPSRLFGALSPSRATVSAGGEGQFGPVNQQQPHEPQTTSFARSLLPGKGTIQSSGVWVNCLGLMVQGNFHKMGSLSFVHVQVWLSGLWSGRFARHL